MINLLDHGYVKLIETWGSDERIVEAARMSTAKGFLGWGPKHAADCSSPDTCNCNIPGDEHLLKFLWDHDHATPFEMAGMVIEVKAPIMVFREWHRHRTQSFNEMSARYIPLPDENYVPSIERIMMKASTTNKQAGAMQGSIELTPGAAGAWIQRLIRSYDTAQFTYESGLSLGIPKELARLCLPVGRYSCMRASANLRNWLGFLKLRCTPGAQWEIRQYANAVASLVKEHFPRTYEVSRESTGMP